MECNKDEAVRAREIAVRKFTERDYASAKKFALKAQNLFADLEGISQFLTTLDIYISSEIKVSGEIDWYGILGVSPFADDDTIRKQYRKLALNLHPDKNKSVGAEGAFKLVSEAWSLLSDKSKRLMYNQKRSVKIPSQNRQMYSRSQTAASNSNGYHNFSSNVPSSTRTTDSSRSGVSSVPPQFKRPDTFWTVCNRCKTHYEYLRVYLNHTLLCPNCSEAFLATERPPPPNVFKSSNWSSHSQHQNSRQNTTRHHPVNPGMHCGPQSKATGFGSMVGSSSAVAQAASVVQQASDKLKRDREGSTSTAEWERNHSSKVTGDSFQTSDGPLKKRKIDEVPSNGCASYMGNHMGMGNGASSWERIFGSLKKNNSGPERTYTFSGSNMKLHSQRELSMFEIRKMLMDKAKAEIQKKLEGWRSASRTKVANIEKEGKKQKSPISGITIDIKNCVGEADNSKNNQNGSSVSDKFDGNEQDPAPMIINVPDPDFHNFDMDRTENSFDEDQVWAAYDDDDGMPRFYARVHKVISSEPFRMRISWLNYRSNVELGPINWVDSGFTKTCGDFRAGKHEITETLNSFSHKVRWTKGARGIIRIFPGKGEVWALYKNWSSDWNEQTPDVVIHKYDMVEVLEDFSEEQGVTVVPLTKVAGFRTVFQRHKDNKEVRRIPKEEMFRFSHQVPNHLLTGEEAHNSPKGCRELDPAATPLDLLQATPEAPMIGEPKENNA